MRAEYYDGQEELFNAEELEKAQGAQAKLAELMEDPAVKRVSLHKPGDEVQMRDGTEYVVQADGSWKRKYPKVTKHTS